MNEQAAEERAPKERAWNEADVNALAEQQWGVVSRRQLHEIGLTDAELRWRVGRQWRVLLPGVLMLEHGQPTDRQRVVAAQLAAGEGSWIAGRTAVEIHSGSQDVSVPIEVLVPAPRKPRTIRWVRIRSTTMTDERLIPRGPLQVSCLARALIDTAVGCDNDDQAIALIVDAVQSASVRLADLEHWANCRGSHGQRRLAIALKVAASNAWSLPENDLSGLANKSEVLPPHWLNPTVQDEHGNDLTSPDLWFPEECVAVMVHSKQYHAGNLLWEETVAQDSDLASVGIPVLGVTPAAIWCQPAKTLERLERIWLMAAKRPWRPTVTAQPRLVR